MQRPSKAISQEGVRKRAARGERALRGRSCAAVAVKSLVEALEARVFLSVASTSSGDASPIAVVLPITAAGPNNGGLSAPPSLAKTPAQLRGAYGLGQYGASNITFGGVQGDGRGQTIAIIDVYDDPNAVGDLHNFDVAMGLPDPPSFIKVNESGDQTPANLPGTDPSGPGGTSGSGTWEEEESLDIEYSHAMAPRANLILVECASPSYDDLIGQGVNWARYQPTVSAISMSFGGAEWSGETYYDQYFTTPAGHQGITFIASTGDSGAYDPGTTTKDVEYPAISPDVLAVGGTRLTLTNGNTGLGWSSERGWGNGTSSGTNNGGGGGVSTVEARPSYQIGVVGNSVNGTPTNGHRTIPDISAEADPNAPGVALYDSYDFSASTPWLAGYEGGTSLSAPLVAGMVAVADQGRALSGLPTFDGPNELLPAIYTLHASSNDYRDITTGNNGFAAATGYDLVTGIGTPIANNLLPDLISIDTAPVLSSFTASPDPVSSQSTDVTLRVAASNSPTEVDYYVETNGIPGLQTGGGGDLEMQAVTNPAGGFALDFGNYGPSPSGDYTFYAVAKNSFGIGQTGVASSLFTAGTGSVPTIGALTATTSPVADTSLTLTAGSLQDNQAATQFVNFWQESNGIAGLQVGPGGDTLVGSATASSGNNWNVITTAPTMSGSYIYYAQSSDYTPSANNLNPDLASADGTSAISVSVTVVSAAASQLAFTTAPANGFAGVTLVPVIAEVEDQFGNLVTSDTSTVSLTLNGGNFTGGSTVSVNTLGGIATFNNLAIIPVGSYTITASDGALTPITSPSFTISPAASLSALVTTNGATAAVPGQAFTFTVTIANGGQTNVTGAAVFDAIPAGVALYNFGAIDNGQGATGYTVSGSGTTGGINDTVNLPAGAIITYFFTCNINPTATGSLTDTATVSTPGGTLNPNANVNGSTQTNQNSATLTLTPVADSYVAITGGDPLAVGSVDVYTIVVTNNGPSAITGTPGTTGLTVADNFSSLNNVTYVSQVLYGTAAGNTQGASPVDSLSLGDVLTMGTGAIVQYTITGTISGGAPSTLTDTVSLTPPAGTTDPTSANNNSSVSAAVSATATAAVMGRSIFYLDSSFDGTDTGAPTTADFNAIAPDKTPLLPGQTATFNNYSGYVSGINGLFIDISGDPNPSNIVPSDLEFIVGNSNTPGTGSSPGSGWSTLATAPSITPFPGQGVNNSDRFALAWPNGTISGKWVQVTVLADANTGLATPDVFYFGSAPGDTGSSTADAHVNATDEIGARNDPHNFSNPASLSDPNDFNRDSFVNATDEIIARLNPTNFSNALQLISVPGLPSGAGVSAPATIGAAATPATTTASPAGVSTPAVGASSVLASSTSAPVLSAHVVTPAVSFRAAAPLGPKASPILAPARSTTVNQPDDQEKMDSTNLRSRLKSLIRFISPSR